MLKIFSWCRTIKLQISASLCITIPRLRCLTCCFNVGSSIKMQSCKTEVLLIFSVAIPAAEHKDVFYAALLSLSRQVNGSLFALHRIVWEIMLFFYNYDWPYPHISRLIYVFILYSIIYTQSSMPQDIKTFKIFIWKILWVQKHQRDILRSISFLRNF